MLKLVFCVIISIITINVNAAAGDNIVVSDENRDEFRSMVNHVKALHGHFDQLDIRKEMEYISHSSLKILRRIFSEYFGNDGKLGWTEVPDFTYKQYKTKKMSTYKNPEVYVLGSGSLARYETTVHLI